MANNDIGVVFINESVHGLDTPTYATKGAAGMDIRSDEEYTLKPMERHLFSTGIKMSIPIGYECQVRPRSGLAVKNGITVLNTPGTIDSDYRGEIGVCLINLSDEPYTVAVGERIAQLVFAQHAKALKIVPCTLDSTERGDGAYGHTGKY